MKPDDTDVTGTPPGLTWDDFISSMTSPDGSLTCVKAANAWWDALPVFPSTDADAAAWKAYADALQRSSERSRLINLQPDGRTLHIFCRAAANDDWTYGSLDALAVQEILDSAVNARHALH